MCFLGTNIGRSFGATYELTDDDEVLVVQGFREFLAGEALELDPSGLSAPHPGDDGQCPQPVVAAEEKEATRAFLAEAAAAEGAQVTDSGPVFVSITEGSSESPTATDAVRVHYTLRRARHL